MSRCTSLFASLLLSSLAACSFDAPAEDAPTTAEMQAVLDTAHPALGELPVIEHLSLNKESRTTFVAGQLGFELDTVGAAFELSESKLILKQSDRDQLGRVVERYAQERDGLEVVGGDLRISREDDGSIHSASGLSWDPEQEIMEAELTASQALDTAIGATEGVSEGSEGRLVYIAPSDGSSPVLAWHHVLEGNRDGMPVVDDVYVNAATGEIADRSPRVHSARLRATYNAGGQEVQGTLARNENTGLTGDTDVDEAHESAGLTYDCLQTLFSRDSFDNSGAALTSIANFGQNFQNAFWDGTQMTYGDGMGVPDIGTHEFVHAVTQYTGNMVYQNEPGALNEAWSDIISAICQANTAGAVTDATWQLGETSILGTLRYMNNPTQDGISSDHYDSRYLGTEDEGGVHLNSGIANLAFVLLTDGGTHPTGKTSVNVVPIGIADAGQIFYLALSSYMSVGTDFAGARVATEKAAADLFGAGSSKAVSVSEAWQAVGVGGPAPQRLEEEPTPEDPTAPDQPDDGTGPGDGTGGGGGNGGGTQAGTGTVTGGCSTGGSGSSTGYSLLLLLGFASLFRRKENG